MSLSKWSVLRKRAAALESDASINISGEGLKVKREFLTLFAKALLVTGSPSHRIEEQIKSLIKAFDLKAQIEEYPGDIHILFGSEGQPSNEGSVIQEAPGVHLSNIHKLHFIYRKVIRHQMLPSKGILKIQKLLDEPPLYGKTICSLFSFIISALICALAFGGSLNDMWVAGFMGLLVRFIECYTSAPTLSQGGALIFCIFFVSFIARAAASFSSQVFCFYAISSAGVIGLLPGYIILMGALDISRGNLALGTPKVVSGLMRSLFLGFGLTMGSDAFLLIDPAARRALSHLATQTAGITIDGFYNAINATTNSTIEGDFSFVNETDPTGTNLVQGCYRDESWGWYLQPLPSWSDYIIVPVFIFITSLKNQQHWRSRQMAVMILIACVSFWTSHYLNTSLGLKDHPDYVALIGSWIIGILGNSYSRLFGGTAYTVMLSGILLLVPGGLSAAAGLAASPNSQGEDEYSQSFTLARQLFSVVLGIIAGTFFSVGIVYLFGKKKRGAFVTF